MKQTEPKQNPILTTIQPLFQSVAKGILSQVEKNVQLLSMIEMKILGKSLSSRGLNPLDNLVQHF